MSLSDSNSHVPASSGTYDYNATPNVGATLAVGASYTDPVFSEDVRRLTNIGSASSVENNYAFHCVNCDGTLMFSWTGGGTVLNIIHTSDGSVYKSSQPIGLVKYEVRWSMTDPNIYTYFSGTSLLSRNLSLQTSPPLRNFTVESGGTNLQDMGGTANYVDRTQRYYLVEYNTLLHVWDSQTNFVFTGTAPGGANWSGLSPSGKTIMRAGVGGTFPHVHHYAYTVDLVAQTVNGTPVDCYGGSSDHGGLISASNGKELLIINNADQSPSGIYAFDTTIDTSAMSMTTQLASNTLLASFDPSFANGYHCSPGSLGAAQDWIFIDTEEEVGGDAFSDANFVAEWRKFRQEIFAVDVVTGVLRRLAHHRSRGNFNSFYFCQPKVSCAANGSFVYWSSNMNDSTPADYADLYGIANPLGAEPPPPPTVIPPSVVPRSFYLMP